MASPHDILKQYWGYDAFRPMQEPIIESVLEGQSTLALLPTGGGKSICFQVPGMCLEGITLVISPLISLMKDQVEQLKKRGIRAAAIYSGMSRKEIDITLDNCIYGNMKFLYVSPERIQTDLFLERATKMPISLLAIDEAHCISQWGYDFRPTYLRIAEFIKTFAIDKVIALTASATPEVKADIIDKLALKGAQVFEQSFARPNLSYSVFKTEKKHAKMLEILGKVPGTSVVYVRSRKQTREIAEFLRREHILADYYHAGLTGEQRSTKQDAWIKNRIRVIVATNAFGMGIDKPDVRTVIHLDLPDSLEAYYQEAGRAGRDERKAYAILLYTDDDVNQLMRRIEQAAVSAQQIRHVYQALANYFKLAVGSNAYASFTLDYESFVKNFDLNPVETYHCFNKLAEEGYIQITESYRELSRIMFLLPQDQIYRYQVANQSMDPVIKILMRLYGGELFSMYIQIKESEIATLLHEPVDVVIKQLEFLHQAEVLEYQHASEQPKVTFLTPRQDATNLQLDVAQINWRRKVTHDKAVTASKFAHERLMCRTRFIQAYFGEITETDCGVCDNCLRRKKEDPFLLEKQVLGAIKLEMQNIDSLKEQLPHVNEEQIISALRSLLDQKKIHMDDQENFQTSDYLPE